MGYERLITAWRFGRWAVPVFRWNVSLGLLGVFVFVGQLRALAVMTSLLTSRQEHPIEWLVFSQFTGALGVWLACPIALLVVSRFPRPESGWIRFILTHVGGFLLFSLAQTHFMFGLRALFGPSLGLPGWPPVWLAAAAWEIQQNVVVYAGLVVLIALLFAWEERRRAELNAARLDAEIAASRLDALTSRVDPHFLFNTLNTVSQEMFRDPESAERLLAGLSEMLRATLEQSGPTWPLRQECEHVGRYVEILRARFGGRVSVRLPEAGPFQLVLVPRFSLQTIVENAVKHNADRSLDLAVRVAFESEGDFLRCRVDDDGVGFEGAPLPKGRGLDRLAETLRLIDERSRLVWGSGPAGGARVEFQVPVPR